MVTEITTKWLIENEACVSGVNWFRKNYPDGLKITKKNITELFHRLFDRPRRFKSDFMDKADVYGACRQMDWLLDNLIKGGNNEFFNMDWDGKDTTKKLISAWWSNYKSGDSQ